MTPVVGQDTTLKQLDPPVLFTRGVRNEERAKAKTSIGYYQRCNFIVISYTDFMLDSGKLSWI